MPCIISEVIFLANVAIKNEFNENKKYSENKQINNMSIKTFHETFSKMNLGLNRPKKDQCGTSVGYKTRNISEENYRSHIQRKDAARDEKAKDKENDQQQHAPC